MSKSFKSNAPFFSAAEAFSRWQARQEEREAKATLTRESFSHLDRDTPLSLSWLPRSRTQAQPVRGKK